MIATATPGQQGPDSVTHSGPASVGARKDPTGQEHAPFKGPHDYVRQELVAPPEPIGKLGNLRPQVAKLRTLGTVVLAGRNGGFFSLAKPGTGHFLTIGRFSNHYKPSLRRGNRLSWGASVLTPVHVVWASSKQVRNWLTIRSHMRPGCGG